MIVICIVLIYPNTHLRFAFPVVGLLFGAHTPPFFYCCAPVGAAHLHPPTPNSSQSFNNKPLPRPCHITIHQQKKKPLMCLACIPPYQGLCTIASVPSDLYTSVADGKGWWKRHHTKKAKKERKPCKNKVAVSRGFIPRPEIDIIPPLPIVCVPSRSARFLSAFSPGESVDLCCDIYCVDPILPHSPRMISCSVELIFPKT